MNFAASNLVQQEQFSEKPFYSVKQLKIDNDLQSSEDRFNNWVPSNDSDIFAFFWNALQSTRVDLSEILNRRIRLMWLLYINSLEDEYPIDIPSSYSPGEFFAVLSSKLIPLGFTDSEIYSDSYHGRVIDYFYEKERITCIVSSEHVQILTYLRGEFDEKVFARTKQGKEEISEYIDGLCKKLEV